jgi:hypothetical protein
MKMLGLRIRVETMRLPGLQIRVETMRLPGLQICVEPMTKLGRRNRVEFMRMVEGDLLPIQVAEEMKEVLHSIHMWLAGIGLFLGIPDMMTDSQLDGMSTDLH